MYIFNVRCKFQNEKSAGEIPRHSTHGCRSFSFFCPLSRTRKETTSRLLAKSCSCRFLSTSLLGLICCNRLWMRRFYSAILALSILRTVLTFSRC